tara:strand:+ start:302 stop:724 length:423 start_codon:yes stop_codon:yes gene_type:complete
MGILNSKQNDDFRSQYIREKQKNNILQENLSTVRSHLQHREENQVKLNREILFYTESVASLQLIQEKDILEKDNLKKSVQHLEQNNLGLTSDKRILVEELTQIQQELNMCKKHNRKLVEAIKFVDITIDSLSDVTMSESS